MGELTLPLANYVVVCVYRTNSSLSLPAEERFGKAGSQGMKAGELVHLSPAVALRRVFLTSCLGSLVELALVV